MNYYLYECAKMKQKDPKTNLKFGTRKAKGYSQRNKKGIKMKVV